MKRSRCGRVSALCVLVHALCVCAMAAGCRNEAKEETQQLSQAVAAFRHADNAEKPKLAQAVRDAPCSSPPICAAKARCLKFVDPTASALETLARVKSQMGGGDADPLAQSAALARAQAELGRGRDALEACDIGLRRLQPGR